ncbi:MAG: HD domain-containing protein [Candidatus Promineifilaceae bacterium]
MIDYSRYQGRWVAILRDRVIADGETAVAAYRAAREIDPAEDFYIDFVEEQRGEKLPFASLLDRVRPFLEQQGRPVYLVGGTVRDALLGRTSHDLDFVVPREAIQLTFRVADAIGAPAYVLDKERDTGRIVLSAENMMMDFSRYRGPDLFADLADRDFTINALAIALTARTKGAIIDPTGGLADLDAGLLRLTQPDSLRRDPARAMRAVRLAKQLGYRLTPESEAAVAAAAPALSEISAERVRDELLKIMGLTAAAEAVEQLYELGLLAVVLPEVDALASVEQSEPHHEAVLPHTISVLRWLGRLERSLFSEEKAYDPALGAARSQLAPYLEALDDRQQRAVDGGLDGRLVLRLAALFHDTGKKDTMTYDDDEGRYRFFGHAEEGAELASRRLRKLSLSNDAARQVELIVAEHMRPLMLAKSLGVQPSRRAAYRYFKATGDSGLDVGLLSLADHLATYDGPGDSAKWEELLGLVAALFAYYFEQYEETVKPPALVNGRDLMEYLNMHPGPEIGRLLSLIEENQAAGQLNTREEALLFAQEAVNSA